MITVVPVISVWLAASSTVWAYEIATHGALTREAMMQSQLNPFAPDLFVQLGIADKTPTLGQAYFDIGSSGIAVERAFDPAGPRDSRGFGPQKITDANAKSRFRPSADSLPGWLMLGAIREDDVPFDSGAVENNPQDEPGGPFARVLSHFFNPYTDEPLVIGDTQLGARAPDWATGPGNHFGVMRAREAMWRALTLKYSPGQGGDDLPFTPSDAIPTKEALRDAYWATTFRALGDVVHLLQDMAQPQHTRNDPHSGLGCTGSGNCSGGHASFYEHYVDALVKGRSKFVLRERFFQGNWLRPSDREVNVDAKEPSYGDYPIPRFADYRSYFATATGAASLGAKGLANYSNQGFYSAGTNIGPGASAGGHPSPPVDGRGLADLALGDGTVKDANNEPVPGSLTLKVSSVVDALNPGYTNGNVRLSSYGMFDQFLAQAQTRQYTLNHYNYDDQMALLLPRAVAHSAGLIDFFFRGRMEISLPDEGVYGIVDHAALEPPDATIDRYLSFRGFGKIRLRLANSTPSIITTSDLATVPQTMPGGTVVAVLKFHRNLCYRPGLDGEVTSAAEMPGCRAPEEEIVVSTPIDRVSIPLLDAGSNGIELAFSFPKELPINAIDVVLQAVYRGQLGSEADAVVVATKNISEPTFVTTFNDTDRVLIGGRCYDPATVASTDSLWSQLASACKPASGAQRYVTDVCANVPLNVRLTTAATAPIVVATEASGAADRRILPRRFSRFAVLGDPAMPTAMTMGFNNAPLYLRAGATTSPRYPPHRAEQTAVATLVSNTGDAGYHYQVDVSIAIDAYVTHRGVRTRSGQSFVVDGTTGAVGTPCPEADFDNLQGNERYPMPATISGWN